jgi:antitoxin component of RelBE/YafQ-DinJ toxin-antitoxin module
MSEETTIRAEIEIDSELRDRAAKVFEDAGLSFDDAFRLLVTRAAEDSAMPQGLQEEVDAEYDAWLREEIQEALNDPGPYLTSEEVNRHMDQVKADVARKLASGEL